ncbi:MAG: metal ABC transporter substrate-binding protein [Patescibacteria group bacterium]
MNKNLTVGLLLGLAALAVGVITYYNYTLPPLEQSERPVVAATIFPIYDIARHVAGDTTDVKLLLPPGASPHTFEPTPTTLKELRDAAVLYAVGHGADDWAAELLAGTGTPIVVVDAHVTLREIKDDEAEHEHETEETDTDHEHEGTDPHYWLSIQNAKHIAANIADDLVTRNPDLAAEVRANLQKYLAELDLAAADITATLDGIENRRIVTLHDAWYYFAEENDLEIVASFEPSPGREPTPQYLAALGHAVSTNDVRAIYSEPQLSTTTLLPFTEDHGIAIAILDPLGGIDGRDSYIVTMIYNAETIAQNQ